MRLVFLCSSLEPGRDGVGDYTLRLATELAARGHEVACVAVNDRHVQSLALTSHLASSEPDFLPIAVLRLPAHARWRERMRRLQEFLDERQPDWVSLQYVPYGFHHKGLPFGLPRRLARLKGDFKWHLMFHELWIGEEAHFPLRHRLIGKLQRGIARHLCRTLKASVHTSNSCFRNRLLTLGSQVGILPLFSNIPVGPADPDLRRKIFSDTGCFQSGITEQEAWIFIFFGAIHPQWQPEPMMKRIRETMHRAGKKVSLFLSLGETGITGSEAWHRLAESPETSFRFLKIGTHPPNQISQYLDIADFGIVTSSFHLLGKSGSAAAIREHGVPMIVTRVEAPLEESPPSGVILLDEDFESLLLKPSKPDSASSLKTVGDLLETMFHTSDPSSAISESQHA
jgi:hypothetical protein